MKHFQYAEDVDLSAENDMELRYLIDQLYTPAVKNTRYISTQIKCNFLKKSKLLQMKQKSVLVYVPESVYLGILMTKRNDCTAEINRRINPTSDNLKMWSRSGLIISKPISMYWCYVLLRYALLKYQ